MSILSLGIKRRSSKAAVDSFLGGMMGSATFGAYRVAFASAPQLEIDIPDACRVTIRFEVEK